MLQTDDNVCKLNHLLSYYNWAASWQNKQNDCAPSEDSDQPAPTLSRVFAVHIKKAWVLSFPMSAQRRLRWSNWANAQADLSLRWANSHSVGFAVRRLNLISVKGMRSGKWINMKIMKSRVAWWSRLNHFRQTSLALLLSYKPEL